MSQDLNERVVYRCKLHWGIFTIPVFFTLAFMLPGLMMILASRFMLQSIPTSSVAPQLGYFWALAFVPELIGGVVLFLFALVAYLKSEIVLTDSRLRFSTGFFSIGRTEMLLTKIETLTLFEPFIGRILGYGTVAVTGTGGTVFRLRFLPKPEHLHGLLQTMVNASAFPPKMPPQSLSFQSVLSDDSRYMPKG